MTNTNEDDTISVGVPENDFSLEDLSLSVVNDVRYLSRQMGRHRSRMSYLSEKISNITNKKDIKGLNVDLRPTIQLSPDIMFRWESICICTSKQLKQLLLTQLEDDLRDTFGNLKRTKAALQVAMEREGEAQMQPKHNRDRIHSGQCPPTKHQTHTPETSPITSRPIPPTPLMASQVFKPLMSPHWNQRPHPQKPNHNTWVGDRRSRKSSPPDSADTNSSINSYPGPYSIFGIDGKCYLIIFP